MDSETLPTASSPRGVDNSEVSSQRGPGQGEAQDTVEAAPEGQTSATGHMGEQTPMDTKEYDPHLNIILETHTAPESGEQPSSKEGACLSLR